MNIHYWGYNAHNQLSSISEPSTVYKPTLSSDTENLNPVAIATGDSHTLLLTDYGDVYTFGRGSEGQLGHAQRSDEINPRLVSALRHETVQAIACGSSTSYAVTTSGKIYQWGFIHEEGAVRGQLRGERRSNVLEVDDPISHDDQAATSGQLTGLAADQTTMIAVDTEARSAQGNSRRNGGPRQLRDIVMESTEKWLMANDGADLEYYHEMKALGYQNEEVEEFMQQRGKEYHGMLKMGCQRRCCPVPQLVVSLSHIKISTVAAGYAHCMLITEVGHLYACGYNDRGQLGLGHRINSSSFKWVDYLAGKFVVQVSCGQQHTICRAVDRPPVEKAQAQPKSSVFPGSNVGANVYVWGNGMLGQLGLGIRGTSKGRLLPTLITYLQEEFPSGIIDVAAGHNFSVVVTLLGTVYSFGHSEYNQHGARAFASSNYTDPFYYYVPRQILFSDKDGATSSVRILKVTCGSNFSIGIDDTGRVYSWGWNESGVLGHGKGHASSTPACIETLGMRSDSKAVIAVAAGAKHVLTLSSTTSSKAADNYRYLLDPLSAPHTDVEIFASEQGLSNKVYKCHRFILAARSRYLSGYLSSEEKDAPYASDSCLTNNGNRIVSIDLTGAPGAGNLTVLGILEYLYLDKLRDIVVSQIFSSTANHSNTAGLKKYDWFNRNNYLPNDLSSTFSGDMREAMKSQKWTDVSFTTSSFSTTGGPQDIRIQAHKAILLQFEYFQGLFASKFSENQEDRFDNSIQTLSIAGFLEDGITESLFGKTIEFAYCGEISLLSDESDLTTELLDENCHKTNSCAINYDDLHDIMSLLICANRLGHLKLVAACERILVLNLRYPFPENAENCLIFAREFNFPRLERACLETLRIGTEAMTKV